MELITRKDREKMDKERIMVEAATEVFCQKGFEEASMDEMAKRAGFTKRTLYQYFDSKEELFFAVVTQGFTAVAQLVQTEQSDQTKPEQTALERVKTACYGYYTFFKTQPELFKLMGFWGHVKQGTPEKGPKRIRLETVNAQFFKSVTELMEAGRLDGSLKPHLNPGQSALSLVFLLTGFLNQLATTGATFTSHFGLNLDAFAETTIDMLLQTLRAEGASSQARQKGGR